ncbi:unnamed protein product, partial [Trichobilharzia regenti]
KPLNSTYDAPDFKCVYGSDPATSQIDGVEGHRPIIGATDSAISNTNEHYAQATGCVRHTSYIGDDAKQTDGNRRRLDASYDLKDRDILVEHESDSGVLTNRVEAPRLNAVLKSMESPQVADPSNTSSTNSLVPPTVINNAESHEPSQCKQYDVKPHTKTLIPLPSGKLSRLPMPSQKMPSMSVSSRLGSRKSATSEQGSNSAHSTNKTQLSAPKSNIPSVCGPRLSGSGTKSSSIKATQLSNSTKSSSKPSTSSSSSQQNRKSIPHATNSSPATTIRKPSLPSTTSSRGRTPPKP